MTGQRVGYTRVSTLEQNTSRQLDGVEVDRVFADHVSGKDLHRPEFEDMLRFVRDGDTVVVHSMDRLARNLDDLRGTVRGLTARAASPSAVFLYMPEAAPRTPALASFEGSGRLAGFQCPDRAL